MAFSEQAALVSSLGASDPQLVVVFEAIDEREDLTKAAELAGLEILTETTRSFAPDANFPRKTANKNLPVAGCLHAVCINEGAKANVVRQWRKWQSTGKVDRGYGPIKTLFAHLKDVRPWGPADRLRFANVSGLLDGMLPGEHSVEIELWFRRSAEERLKAEVEVSALISESGGSVTSTAQMGDVGYHGMKCTLPLLALQRLAAGDYDAVSAAKSAAVMYLNITGQSQEYSPEVSPTSRSLAPMPVGDPVLCILDGVPVANHPSLAGRVTILDPDDLAGASMMDTKTRRHGTAMASVAVWGDLGNIDHPAERPVLVRPILTPARDTTDSYEELPATELAPDLMRRVFRELFGADGAANSVVVVNLSVGDPAVQFDGVMSSWARTLDWLSFEYGVLVVVSAGNHPAPEIPQGVEVLASLIGAERAKALATAVAESTPRRSLLAPADSINAITVGALNSDSATQAPLAGYQFDPADGELIVSPTSALGLGHHRSVKPDVVAPGGRVRFARPMTASETHPRPAIQGSLGPGIRVAGAEGGEVFTMGTSPAAALIAREAARAVDAVTGLADRPLMRSELAVATKAMLAHGASVPDKLVTHDELGHESHGYGSLARRMVDGCAPHEAAILYVGKIGENEARTLSFPLPNGLQVRGLKRVTATLAWISPVNWRHRQYRRAGLEFSKPTGFANLGSAVGAVGDRPKRGTLQRVEWEFDRSVGVGAGSDLELTVKCKGQAGGLLGQTVDFAVVLSLWVAPELRVDVYSQVKEQVATRVAVRPEGV